MVVTVLATSLVGTACGTAGSSGGGEDEVPGRVDLIVPFAEGGGTDTWARLVAPYLQQNVKGNPSVQVVNRPGGESITGTNQFVRQGKDDGSELLVSSATVYAQWMLGRPQVAYDFTKLKPLMINGTGGVIYVSKDSGITKVQDLKSPPKPLSYGGITPTGNDLNILLAFDLLKMNVKTTFGFEGRGPAALALQRGETNIDFQTTSAYNTQIQPVVDEGKAIPLMSFGVLNEQGKVVRDPNFKSLPTVPEAYEMLYGSKPSGPGYDAYVAFLGAGFSYSKGLWAKPDTPQSVRQAFIDAVPKMEADKKFESQRTKALGNYPLYQGDKVEKALNDAFTLSGDVKQYVSDLLKNKYDTEIK